MKPLIVTWAKMPETVGGCESIFQDLANKLDGKLITYPFGNSFPYIKGMPSNFKTIEEYKSWIFDDMLHKELLKEKKPIIANCGVVNIWRKHDTKIINIYNDPYALAQEVMVKNRSKFIYNHNFISYMADMQKVSAKGAYNIAVSNIAKEAMEKIGIKCDNVIEHGVDATLFKPMSKVKLRKKYGIDASAKVGIFVGIEHPIKNWECINWLIDNKQDIYWIIVFKENWGLKYISNGQIFVKVPRKQMVELYNLADFVIMPSYFESFGLVPIEAGLCNVPVVASRTGWIEDKGITDYGIVVNGFKPKAYSKAIDKIFEYGFKPRKYMKKRFDFEKWIKKWKNLMEVNTDV